MKKIFITTIALLLGAGVANAQQGTAGNKIDPANMAQVLTLPKATRDSLAREIRKTYKITGSTIKVNGEDMSTDMAGPMKKYSRAIAELMIGVLESSDQAVAEKNQQKYFSLLEELSSEMEEFTENVDYEINKKELVDDFKKEEYRDSKEKHEARKEMNEDLRSLKTEHKDRLKEIKQERDKKLKRKVNP